MGRQGLSEAASFFRHLVERGADAIAVVESEGSFLYCNPRMESTLGYRRDELAGRTLFELIHEDDRARVIRRFDRELLGAERSGPPGSGPPPELSFAARVRHRDETFRTVAAVARVLDGDPAIEAIAVTAREVADLGVAGPGAGRRAADELSGEGRRLSRDEKRKLEEQWARAQRMEAMGRLSCAVAHDFNNLLTAILGYTELIGRSVGPDAPCRPEIEEVKKAGQQAASLTRQLLTFGKGKMVEARVVRLNEVIRDMKALLIQLVGGKVELNFDLAADLDPVKVDRSQLEQVVLNLALNARDAMDGDGRLTVSTQNHRVERAFVLHHDSVQPGDYAVLAVRDTGCGIEPAIMEHLFEPFFTTKEPGEGTGLGLSTVYGVVKQSGGFISVYNEPSGGVTFKVSFPCAQEVEEPRREGRPPATGESREALTVLVAEDDPVVRRLVVNALESRGFTTLTARDGVEALALSVSHPGPIDLLLTDIAMPRLNGLALAERFSDDRPSAPILLISGTASGIAPALRTTVPVEFLEKPFTPSELLAKVETLL